MRLSDARAKFKELRKDVWRIRVTDHAWQDHPERKFTRGEIVELVNSENGTLRLNNSPEAAPGSFLFVCTDSLERHVKMSVKFETAANGEMILVVNAYRKV